MTNNVIELKYFDGEVFAELNNDGQKIPLSKLINIMKNGVRTNEIKFHKKTNNIESTSYIFVDNNDGGLISIRYKNSEKAHFKQVIDNINMICKINPKLKFVNYDKLIAIVTAGTFVLTSLIGVVCYSINKNATKDLDDGESLPDYYYTHQLTDEQREQESLYFENLEKKAKDNYESLTENEKEELLKYQIGKEINQKEDYSGKIM